MKNDCMFKKTIKHSKKNLNVYVRGSNLEGGQIGHIGLLFIMFKNVFTSPDTNQILTAYLEIRRQSRPLTEWRLFG